MKRLSVFVLFALFASSICFAGDWSGWKGSNYKGISYRTKNTYKSTTGKHEVYVEFKNETAVKVWISYDVICGTYNSDGTTDVAANKTKRRYITSSGTSSSVNVVFVKVK